MIARLSTLPVSRPSARAVRPLRNRERPLLSASVRRRISHQAKLLDERGFVLISNNCLAGQLYELADIRKDTPTAGLFFAGRAFPQFLEAVASNRPHEWQTLEPAAMTWDDARGCPVMATADDAAVVFLHYPTAKLAADKWNRRYPRLAGRRHVVLATLRGGLTQGMLDGVLGKFDHFHVIGPAEAPPADELIVDRRRLGRIADFFDDLLARTA